MKSLFESIRGRKLGFKTLGKLLHVLFRFVAENDGLKAKDSYIMDKNFQEDEEGDFEEDEDEEEFMDEM